MVLSLPKTWDSHENGENDKFAFYTPKQRFWSSEMKKIARVTLAKPWFTESVVFTTLAILMRFEIAAIAILAAIWASKLGCLSCRRLAELLLGFVANHRYKGPKWRSSQRLLTLSAQWLHIARYCDTIAAIPLQEDPKMVRFPPPLGT